MIKLSEIADEAMVEKGFLPDFPPPVLAELKEIRTAAPQTSERDLRSFFWISIDNDDSRDLDQLTYAEKNKIYIAVADVDALVKEGTAIDHYAAHNTTSVYTPTKVFPMLPLKLSTDLTSLNENTDRRAIVIEVSIHEEGSFELSDIYPAFVRNHAKLAYNAVASWLAEGIPAPFKEQLELQDALAQRIKQYRARQGALYFATVEPAPVLVDGFPVKIEERVYNRAHELIENFMIAANVAATNYLAAQNRPTLHRVVKIPKRWDRIVDIARMHGEKLPPVPDSRALRAFLFKEQRANPENFQDLSLIMIKLIGKGEYVLGLPGKKEEGHFDLALRNYAHATAPNRRYPDLIMQRLIKGHDYRTETLGYLAYWCTKKEDDAVKVERRMQKSAAAMVLTPQIGHHYQAIVTGRGDKGTWVRILTMPIEGKLLEGLRHLDVGDRLNVKLVHTDIVKGHIDFVAI